MEGQFHTYPFIKEDLTNIKIEFNNGNKINFDYKIFKPKIISRQLEEFYEKEMKKYSPDDIIKPTIIEIEQKFIEQNNKTRKLQQSFWDINYQGMIKLKVDHKNKVNVIFQNSFDYFNNIKNSNFDENIILNQKINQNNYPIIIIIDFSSGDYTNFEQIFMLIKAINPSLSLDTLNIAYKNKNDNFTFLIDIDDYGKGIKHKRTKTEREDYKLKIWDMSEELNLFRKPNEIIVFTDGFAVYGNSLFIKNLQESGNAIIVGYNGNPSEKKKNDKFDASQSPSRVYRSFQNDTNAINLKKYGIIVDGITIIEIFNDSYVNKNVTPIPREYLINPIDERSNIYGRYSNNRYNEFINEAKRIFKKYETECNPDNKNMVLLDNSCKFDDKNKIGGFKCINGKWSKECQASSCKKPYTFNTYTKECESNVYTSLNKRKIIIFCSGILILLILIIIIIVFVKKCNKKTNINLYNSNGLEIKLVPEH